MTEIVLSAMTQAEATEWKRRISDASNTLRLLLSDGYERSAWIALGHSTWSDCLRSLAEEYGFTERRLWQLHQANQIEQVVTEKISVGQIPDSHLRPLAGLDPEQQPAVWREVVATAPGGKVTAAHVESVVAQHRPAPQPTDLIEKCRKIEGWLLGKGWSHTGGPAPTPNGLHKGDHHFYWDPNDTQANLNAVKNAEMIQLAYGIADKAKRQAPPPSRLLGDNEVEAVVWRAIDVNVAEWPAMDTPQRKAERRLAWLERAQPADFSRLLNPGVSFEADQLSRIRAKVEAELGKQAKPATQALVSGSKMAVHFSSDNAEHYTPVEVITAVVRCLEAIDLDPCSNSKATPHVPALEHLAAADDGLSHPWFGRVFMNPPYGRAIADWTVKLRDEYRAGNVTEAIALVPARTDTQWWLTLRDCPVCLVIGRLTFENNEDPAPFPSAIFYLGKDVAKFSQCFAHLGDIWRRIDV